MSEYTEQDVDLVSRAFHEVDPVVGARPQDWHQEARAALAALAAAGRLLPPGWQQQEEYAHRGHLKVHSYRCPDSDEVRTVTTFPDGSQHIGAWREVSDE